MLISVGPIIGTYIVLTCDGSYLRRQSVDRPSTKGTLMFGLDRQALFGASGESTRQERLATLRAEIATLRARLAADITGLDPAGDPGCRQALADADERQRAATDLIARATNSGELQVARQTLVEGLAATRFVREKQGLPLGPELPAPTAATPAPSGATVRAFDSVSSGPTPFWKRAAGIGGAAVAGGLLGSALGGAFGEGDGGSEAGWGGDGDGGGGW
jgi:hypothetical protein